MSTRWELPRRSTTWTARRTISQRSKRVCGIFSSRGREIASSTPVAGSVTTFARSGGERV
jgi:hypothetical protein